MNFTEMEFRSTKGDGSTRKLDLCVKLMKALQGQPADDRKLPGLSLAFMQKLRRMAQKTQTAMLVRTIVGSDVVRKGNATNYYNLTYTPLELSQLRRAVLFATSLRPHTPCLRAIRSKPLHSLPAL